MPAAADPPPQLVELAQSEPVRVLDHHDGGIGHVDPDLDHGRGNEHVDVAGAESRHRLLFVRGTKLTVDQPDPKTWATAPRGARARLAEAASTLGLSSTNGQTTNAWRPAPTSSSIFFHAVVS